MTVTLASEPLRASNFAGRVLLCGAHAGSVSLEAVCRERRLPTNCGWKAGIRLAADYYSLAAGASQHKPTRFGLECTFNYTPYV
jgi:hypothetical protein